MAGVNSKIDVLKDWQAGHVPDVRPSKIYDKNVWPRVSAGPERLQRLMDMWLQGLSDEVKDTLRNWLLSAESAETFKIGTFCSGTDCAVLVLEAFLKSAIRVLNIPADTVSLEHMFSCEKESAKRAFLSDMFPGLQLHDDAITANPEDAGYTSAGFPCDDASALHPDSSSDKHRLCGSLRTGSVFRAISKYLSKNKKLKAFQFENVTALASKPVTKNGSPGGPSNLSAVCYILEKEANLWTHVWQLDSMNFGSGQQRHRLYGSSFPKDDLSMSLQSAHMLLDSMMNELAGVTPCHPEEYLLPPTDSEIRSQESITRVSSMSPDDFLAVSDEGGRSLCISTLFQTGGVVPSAMNNKKRRCMTRPTDSSPPGMKWVKAHAEAFEKRGEDGGL
eukprot:Skav204081  [mRNA]  locus=scaffold3129:117954:120142:+ [translate_table: standard]